MLLQCYLRSENSYLCFPNYLPGEYSLIAFAFAEMHGIFSLNKDICRGKLETNSGESSSRPGGSDWADPPPAFHPSTLLRREQVGIGFNEKKLLVENNSPFLGNNFFWLKFLLY